MVDWDSIVVGPLTGVFGEPVKYWPTVDSPVFKPAGYDITGVFDDAYRPAGQLSDTHVISTHPALGIQVSQFPPAYDPERAQGDRFLVLRTGKQYIIKAGSLDSHGAARLDAMEAP